MKHLKLRNRDVHLPWIDDGEALLWKSKVISLLITELGPNPKGSFLKEPVVHIPIRL